MKNARLSITLSVALLLTCLSSNLCGAQASQTHDPTGTYIITNTDSKTGKFVSRGLAAFHADHTLSYVDSGQGGTACSSSSSFPCPYGSFSSELGTWGYSSGILTGRTLDFDFPPPDNNLFRLDWTFTLGPAEGSISGTVTLSYFPLTADPNEGSSTFYAEYTITGYKVRLP